MTAKIINLHRNEMSPKEICEHAGKTAEEGGYTMAIICLARKVGGRTEYAYHNTTMRSDEAIGLLEVTKLNLYTDTYKDLPPQNPEGRKA